MAFKGENTLFGKLTTSFKGMLYHFTQFGAAYKILGAVKQGISNVVTSAKNLDKALKSQEINNITSISFVEDKDMLIASNKKGNANAKMSSQRVWHSFSSHA